MKRRVHFNSSFFSYLEIQQGVQNNIASLEKKNKEVKTRNEEIKAETDREEKLAKYAEEKEKQLEKACKEMDSELQTMKKNRDKWMDKSGSTFYIECRATWSRIST